MANKTYRVLFLCQHNSARSIMAEALMRHWGHGRFEVHSAGTDPLPACNPIALDLLAKAKIPVDGLAPKSWERYRTVDVPAMDFIFHTCETTADLDSAETGGGRWPGHPLVAHWAFPDPAGFKGSEVEQRALFNLLFGMIERRVRIFCALPEHSLARLTAESLTSLHSQADWAAAS